MSDPAEATKDRRPVPRVAELVNTVPWAITDEMLDTIVAVASRENDSTPEALEQYRSRAVPGASLLTVRAGVGILTVTGPLFRYADMFTAISGGATYEGIAQDLGRAQAKEQGMHSLLLNLDTPGGEVNGCAECAEMIHQLSKVMHVETYVGGMAASAGFWLGAATSKITVSETAVLGSIGVRMGYRDTSERDAKSGVKTVEFISSRAPNKRMDVATDAGRARIQRQADQLEAVFIAAVARYRGVSEDAVAAFGDGGGVEIGKIAVNQGLADALGSFEQVVARMQQDANRPIIIRGTKAMAETAPVKTYTQAELDTAAATARTESHTRVQAIMTSPAGLANVKLANHLAFNTTMAAADAIATIEAAGPAAVAAPAAVVAAPAAQAAVAPAPGTRAQDADGGLALATALPSGAVAEPVKAKINSTDIYAKRAKAMQQSGSVN